MTAAAAIIAKRQYTVLKSWPRADATVMKIVPIDKRVRDSRGSVGRYYGADVSLAFSTLARQYLTETRWQFSSKRELEERVVAYAAGTRRTIWYNPADPQDVRLDVGYNWNTFDFAIVFGALGPLMLCAGAGVLKFSHQEQGGRARRRKARPTRTSG